jgi:hypothetical protein
MPNDKHEWQSRIKAVEREHASTRFAIDRLLEEARRDLLTPIGATFCAIIERREKRDSRFDSARYLTSWDRLLWSARKGRESAQRLAPGFGIGVIAPPEEGMTVVVIPMIELVNGTG